MQAIIFGEIIIIIGERDKARAFVGVGLTEETSRPLRLTLGAAKGAVTTRDDERGILVALATIDFSRVKALHNLSLAKSHDARAKNPTRLYT